MFNKGKYLIVAGKGHLPVQVARTLRNHGVEFEIWDIENFSSPELQDQITHHLVYEDSYSKVIEDKIKALNIRNIVFAGGVDRPPYGRVLKVLYQLKKRGHIKNIGNILGDNNLLKTSIQYCKNLGVELISAKDIIACDETQASFFNIGSQEIIERYKSDIQLGQDALHALSSSDIGQAAVVQGKRVVGIEAMEGTSTLIQRTGSMLQKANDSFDDDNDSNEYAKPVFVKLLKDHQTLQMDVPVIGIDTIHLLHKYNFAGLAIDSHTIILEKQTVYELLQKYQMFLYIIPTNDTKTLYTAEKPLKIFFVCAEKSADQLGSKILYNLKKMNIPFIAVGVGGSALRNAGGHCIYHYADFGFYGIEVLWNLKNLFQRRKILIKNIINFDPDIYLSIDGVDLMTFLINKMPKKLRAFKVQYVSPTLWAWRPGRVVTYEKFYNALFCLYPFETPYYFKGFAHFVGHAGLSELYQEHGYKDARLTSIKGKTIGLYLGSRNFEIRLLTKPTVKVLAKLQQEYKFHVIIPTFKRYRKQIEQAVTKYHLDAKVITDPNYDSMKHADIALACAGTITMELTARGVPHFLIYKLPFLLMMWIDIFIALKIFRVRYVHLFNIMLNKMVVPELLQIQFTSNLWKRLVPYNFTEKRLHKQFKNFLDHTEIRNQQLSETKVLLSKLVKPETEFADIYTTKKLMQLYQEFRTKNN